MQMGLLLIAWYLGQAPRHFTISQRASVEAVNVHNPKKEAKQNATFNQISKIL